MGVATLYGTLKRLVDAGLAEGSPRRPAKGDDQRRRYYRLTGLDNACVGPKPTASPIWWPRLAPTSDRTRLTCEASRLIEA